MHGQGAGGLLPLGTDLAALAKQAASETVRVRTHLEKDKAAHTDLAALASGKAAAEHSAPAAVVAKH